MNLLAILGIVAAACGALLGLAAVGRGMWRAAQRIVFIHKAVSELLPNGGSSLADQVARIESRLTKLEEALGVESIG